jgi:uncharacterized membrane protein YdjX (TVP38/TMEM64 family)
MIEEQATNNNRHATMKLAAILRYSFGAMFLVAIIASLMFLPAPQYLKWFLEWIHSLGSWGSVFFIVFYVIVCLFFLPGSILTLAAGFMFGMTWGAVTASLGATLGATAAFLIARVMFHGKIEHRLTTHPNFLRIDCAISGQGFKIVLLTRLCLFFPHDLMSYLFGLTEISLGRYVLGTWLGRLPETLVLAYIGSKAKRISDLVAGKVEFGVERQILLALGVMAMIAVVIVVAYIARKALHEAVDDSNAHHTD